MEENTTKELLISVHNRIAVQTGGPRRIVSDNSDYRVRFLFDEEWQRYPTKTVVPVRADGSCYPPILLTDGADTCLLPRVNGTEYIELGVTAGEGAETIRTSTAATVKVIPSVLELAGQVLDNPSESVWNKIAEKLSSSPDWAQNDPAASDYIKNRIAYTPAPVVIEYSGNPAGYLAVTHQNKTYLRLSETTFPKESIHQVTLQTAGEAAHAMEYDSKESVEPYYCTYNKGSDPAMVMIYQTGGSDYPEMEPGLYVGYEENTSPYTLTIDMVARLAKKYLPFDYLPTANGGNKGVVYGIPYMNGYTEHVAITPDGNLRVDAYQKGQVYKKTEVDKKISDLLAEGPVPDAVFVTDGVLAALAEGDMDALVSVFDGKPGARVFIVMADNFEAPTWMGYIRDTSVFIDEAGGSLTITGVCSIPGRGDCVVTLSYSSESGSFTPTITELSGGGGTSGGNTDIAVTGASMWLTLPNYGDEVGYADNINGYSTELSTNSNGTRLIGNAYVRGRWSEAPEGGELCRNEIGLNISDTELDINGICIVKMLCYSTDSADNPRTATMTVKNGVVRIIYDLASNHWMDDCVYLIQFV